LGKLVAIVGNTGVGKTTLVEAICRHGDYVCATEEHEGRPFQELFTQNHKRYALANQLDYLLRRADQEIKIRRADPAGVQDGGLDQDFHVFTKLFHQKGYLTENEFNICQRQYELIREFLPHPEIVIWLKATPETIAKRFETRDRRLSIAQIEDIVSIDELLRSWLDKFAPQKLVTVDSGSEDEDYPASVELVSRMLDG
jgi:deoxyguanosine kinase